MNKGEHFQRLNRYFNKSKIGYNVLLWGAKHFGFYPKNKKVSEKEAQLLMQDLIGKKLNLSKRMKVLDAGCGQGVVSTYLAKKFGCKIEGVTVVSFEIKEAELLAKKFNIQDKVNYLFMDYSNMKFQNNYFDAIYTIESLSHSTDIKKTLKEFFRVLKKGGKIALFEYTIADNEKFSEYEKDVLNKVIYASAMDSLKGFRHDEFQNMIKEAGFKSIKVENISENVRPSLNRFRKIALIPYFFVKLFGMQKNHPNLTAAVEFYKMGKKDLVRYNIFTAEK
jgi:ubiquinone/menaquinone biosynthesis C-methylase UbiE